MFCSIKTIRIGLKPSKTTKYILEHFPSFFRFFLQNSIFRAFFNFLVSLLEDIFANSPDRHVSVFELVWEQGDHENTDFENQKILPMIYVRDTTEKFVLCENYAFRFTTEVAGLMQPNQLSKPVLALLTEGSVRCSSPK